MRYIRQQQLDVIPNDFQEKIKDKKLVMIGCGGIGSPLAQMLVRGGFLNLVLIDNDIIDITNLQRQIFFEAEVGKLKTKMLKKHLLKINKTAKIKIFNQFLDKNNIDEICFDAYLIIDATDNFETRRLINSYCEKNEKNWLYNGAVKMQVVSCMFYGKDKLFSKVFPKEIKEERACDVGILTSTTSLIASLAYNEITKYFLKIKENKMIKVDLWNYKIHEIKLK